MITPVPGPWTGYPGDLGERTASGLAAYSDAEETWKLRCETLAKRKSSGRWPELSDRLDDDD
jgi:hypothetical protein